MFAPQSDESLVKKARKGNADALDKLIRRYETRIFNFGLRMTGNREDAHDLMQEVFLSMYRTLASYRGESLFSSWLFAIATFRTTDFFRRRRPTEELTEADQLAERMPAEGSPMGAILKKQRNRLLMQALAQLPQEQRLVVELKFFQEQTFEEISQQLDVSINTLKSRLYGALKKIKCMPEVANAM